MNADPMEIAQTQRLIIIVRVTNNTKLLRVKGNAKVRIIV